MAFRPTSRDFTAGILVLVAGLVWSLVGVRHFNRLPPSSLPVPTSVAPSSPAVSSGPAPTPVVEALPTLPAAPSEPDEARRLLARLRTEGKERRAALFAEWKRIAVPEALFPELLAFVREALARDPADPAPLALLAAITGERGGDALLEFAVPPSSKEVRLDAFRLAGEHGYTPAQVNRVAALFAAEPDDDVRVGILLGTSKSGLPAAEDLARRALADPEETVRGVAISSLNAQNEPDRRTLIGLATSDPSDQVRGSAAILLNDRADDPEVLAAVLSVALKDPSPDNRRSVLVSLRREAQRGEPRVLETLQWAADKDASAEVRTQARKVLDSLKKKP